MVMPIARPPPTRARRRSPSNRRGNTAIDGPTAQPSQKSTYVEKPQPTAPTSAAKSERQNSRKKRCAERRARKIVKAQENVDVQATGERLKVPPGTTGDNALGGEIGYSLEKRNGCGRDSGG